MENKESFSASYKDAGVDVTAGYKAVELMKKHVARTKTSGVVEGIGGFGGLFAPDLTGISEPILVSGTDGVGTKLKVAFMMDKHNTIGIDCVAMCANDVACSGAQPLFFLDYIALGKNKPEKVAEIVSGVAEGCVQAGCALVGGETAEMPGLYAPDDYDLAGFCVGIADKSKLIDGSKIVAGDVLIGVESSGLHSNGFSLVRKAFNLSEERLGVYVNELGKTLGEELLTPTKIYIKAINAMKTVAEIKGISHITGGGFYENIPRMFKGDLRAVIIKKAVPEKPIFNLLRSEGIPERDMFNTFNMGIGICAAVSEADAPKVLAALEAVGERAHIIGRVEAGSKGVDIC